MIGQPKESMHKGIVIIKSRMSSEVKGGLISHAVRRNFKNNIGEMV